MNVYLQFAVLFIICSTSICLYKQQIAKWYAPWTISNHGFESIWTLKFEMRMVDSCGIKWYAYSENSKLFITRDWYVFHVQCSVVSSTKIIFQFHHIHRADGACELSDLLERYNNIAFWISHLRKQTRDGLKWRQSICGKYANGFYLTTKHKQQKTIINLANWLMFSAKGFVHFRILSFQLMHPLSAPKIVTWDTWHLHAHENTRK